MLFLEKFKESLISVIPIMGLVLLLHLTVAPLGPALPQFLIGGVLLILGLSIFLVGTEVGVLPVGQKTGAALTSRRNLSLMLVVGFLVGFFITVAEPDVWVLAAQVAGVAPDIQSVMLVSMIAVGVGFFVAVAMGRIILQVPLRLLLLVFYLLVFICAVATEPAFVGIGFDAGGATTGPMTVPFIMALGVGVAAVRGGRAADDSFGFVGLASIGPIIAVLIMGTFFYGGSQATSAPTEAVELSLVGHFLHLVPEVTREVIIALGPLVVLFFLFQLFLLHMPPSGVARMVKGLIHTFLGLICFFVGVKGGFIPVGTALGGFIAGDYSCALIPVGLLTGMVVVCAEPAVWVLTDQVEQVSGGHIRKRLMLGTLSRGVGVAVAIAMFRVSTGVSIWYFLVPGYLLALSLTFFCPQMFTAIAFDSGGVASGPMASTFILAFTLGASSTLGGNPITDAFGVIAMIAMTPLIAIQVLGILFHRKVQQEALKRVGQAPDVPAASSVLKENP